MLQQAATPASSMSASLATLAHPDLAHPNQEQRVEKVKNLRKIVMDSELQSKVNEKVHSSQSPV